MTGSHLAALAAARVDGSFAIAGAAADGTTVADDAFVANAAAAISSLHAAGAAG